MKKNLYFLVALDEMPRIINLDSEKLNEKNQSKLYNLAYIDYLVSNYEEKEIRDYLYKKNIIKFIDTPIFIVHPYNYREQLRIKFIDPIFYSNDNKYLETIALTTIRKRALSLKDTGYMLSIFEDKYYNDSRFQEFVQNMINHHDLKYLLEYRENKKNKNTKDNISYNSARDVFNCLYQYSKHKIIDSYYLNTYGQSKFYDSVLRLIKNKLENLDIKDDEIEDFDVRELPWDNKKAQEYLKNNKYYIDIMNSLTLEDRYHAGLIDYNEYCIERREGERKFHK